MGSAERLIEVPLDVVEVLKPDRDPDHVRTDARFKLLFVGPRAFVGHAGKWRMVENPLGAAAPTSDYLSLLSATRRPGVLWNRS